MNSMTGFGKGEAAVGGSGRVVVELNSVNRKQLEVRMSLPPELAAFETELRRQLAAAVARGAVQMRVMFHSGADGAGCGCSVNRPMLEMLVREAMEVRRACGLTPESVAVESLMCLSGVVTESSIEPDSAPELREALTGATAAAVEALRAMRAAEGENLKRDFEERLGVLEELLNRIEPLTAGIPAAIRERLLEKLSAEKLPVDTNDERLLKEVLFYADKADVTEEITRLRSHFVQFRRFLEERAPVGRSLDFLMQELFREITTLGNKAGTPAISPLTVRFKSELEKLREQIQNVE